MPLTVQLLGTRDDLVSRADTIDLQCGRNFVYLDVPESDHVNILRHSGPAGKLRKEVFLKALLTPVDDLPRQSNWDSIPALKPNPDIERAVLLMHGIRDEGRWPVVVGKKLESAARQRGQTVAVITASYGYFPMLLFLLGPFRQKNVLWFMDRYT